MTEAIIIALIFIGVLGLAVWILESWSKSRERARVAEERVRRAEEASKRTEEANAIKNNVARLSNDAVHDRLYKRWKRD